MNENRTGKPPLDHEVIALLRDDPELLAIADALAATHVRTRRARVPVLLAAALLAVAAASIAVVALSNSPSLVDRALAAVGNRPLLHIEVERSVPNDVLVDPHTGREERSTIRVSAFADESTGLLRVRVLHNGTPVADQAAELGVPAAAAGVDRLLARFARDYRPALRAGAVSKRAVDGAPTLTLPGDGVTVTLAKQGRPRQISGTGRWNVLAATSTADRRLLDPKPPAAGFGRGDVDGRAPLSLGEARSALEGKALVPLVAGAAPRRAFRERLASVAANGRTRRSGGLRLEYDGVVVSEALAPEAAYGFAEGRYTFDFNPVPGNALDLHGRAGGLWTGQFKIGSVFVTLRSRERDRVLAAASALVR